MPYIRIIAALYIGVFGSIRRHLLISSVGIPDHKVLHTFL